MSGQIADCKLCDDFEVLDTEPQWLNLSNRYYRRSNVCILETLKIMGWITVYTLITAGPYVSEEIYRSVSLFKVELEILRIELQYVRLLQNLRHS